jgi:hypothetical protein
LLNDVRGFHLHFDVDRATIARGSDRVCGFKECNMRYRSLAISVAAFALAPFSANAQSVYVAPGGVYIASGPVYVTPAAPVPYGPPAPVVPAPTSAYGPPPVYGPPAQVYAAPTTYDAPAVVYATPAKVYQGPVYQPGPVYQRGYDAVEAYAAVPRPPAPVPYRARYRW